MSLLFRSPTDRWPAHNSSSSNVRGPDLTIYVSLSPPDGTELLKNGFTFLYNVGQRGFVAGKHSSLGCKNSPKNPESGPAEQTVGSQWTFLPFRPPDGALDIF